MFLGSSWHQTISAFLKRDSSVDQRLQPGTDRAARGAADRRRRCRASRAPRRGRNRPCPSTARRGGSCRPWRSLIFSPRRGCGIVPQHAVERRARRHLGEPRHRPLVAQQRLRRHQDQRLAELAVQLAAQDVEIVGRRRAVGDLHVVFGAQLQEALEARGGVLRPLALVAVRQQADEARHAQPLALARRDELVEHHLRAVGEVAELRLPQRQRVRLGQRVAVFEAEHRLFRQHRVDDLVMGLVRSTMVERDVALFGLLVDQHRMALREGAALAVLARQAHRIALVEQRARRPAPRRSPSRCPRPSRSPCGGCRGSAAMVLCTLKSVGHRGDALGRGSRSVCDVDAGLRRGARRPRRRGLEARPAAVQPVGLVGLVGLAGLELGLETRAPVGLHLVDLACGDDAFARSSRFE